MNFNDRSSDAARPPKKKKLLSYFLRITVTGLLFYIISRKLDFNEFRNIITNIHYGWLLATCGSMVIIRLLMAMRWHYVLLTENIKKSLLTLSRAIYLSYFFGQFFPGTLGIEAIRGYEVAKDRGMFTQVAVTMIIDRLVGVASMITLAFIGAILAEITQTRKGLILPMAILQVGFYIGLYILCLLGPKIEQTFSRIQKEATIFNTIVKKVLFIISSVSDLPRLIKVFPRMFNISLLVQFYRCIMFYCLYNTFGTTIPFVYLMIFIPIVFVVLLLPVTIGGLGLREGSLIYLLGTVGVSPEVSVGVGLLSFFLGFIVSLPVVVVWIFEKKPSTQAENIAS
jgi:uncharacterized protein (TIRG00374 family)